MVSALRHVACNVPVLVAKGTVVAFLNWSDGTFNLVEEVADTAKFAECSIATVPLAVMREAVGVDYAPLVSASFSCVEFDAEDMMKHVIAVLGLPPSSPAAVVWRHVSSAWQEYAAGRQGAQQRVPFRWSWFGSAHMTGNMPMQTVRFAQEASGVLRATFYAAGLGRHRKHKSGDDGVLFELVVDSDGVLSGPAEVLSSLQPVLRGDVVIPEIVACVKQALGIEPFRVAWPAMVATVKARVKVSQPVLPASSAVFMQYVAMLGGGGESASALRGGLLRAIQLVREVVFQSASFVEVPLPSSLVLTASPRHVSDRMGIVVLSLLCAHSTAVMFRTPYSFRAHPAAPMSVWCVVLELLNEWLVLWDRAALGGMEMAAEEGEWCYGDLRELVRATALREPMESQWRTIDWVQGVWRRQRGVICANDMGSGKSYVTLLLLLGLPQWVSTTHLVLCPPAAKAVWVAEAAKCHGLFDVVSFRGVADLPALDRALPTTARHRLVVVEYDLFKGVEQLLVRSWGVMVCDESHWVRNISQRSVAAGMVVSQLAIGLSGTPWQLRNTDLCHQAGVLGIPCFAKDMVQSLSRQELGVYLRQFMCRFAKGFIIAKHEMVHFTELVLSELVPYDHEARQLRAMSMVTFPNLCKLFHMCERSVHKLSALVEYCNGRVHQGPRGVLGYFQRSCSLFGGSAEPGEADWREVEQCLRDNSVVLLPQVLSRLIADSSLTVDEAVATRVPWLQFEATDPTAPRCDERVLVFCANIASALYVVEAFGAGGAMRLASGEDVEMFERGGRHVPRVAVAVLGSFSEGFSLVSARNVVFFQQVWNPAVLQQAVARVARLGQRDRVLVACFVVEDSIEQRQHEIVRDRELCMSYVQSVVSVAGLV